MSTIVFFKFSDLLGISVRIFRVAHHHLQHIKLSKYSLLTFYNKLVQFYLIM